MPSTGFTRYRAGAELVLPSQDAATCFPAWLEQAHWKTIDEFVPAIVKAR